MEAKPPHTGVGVSPRDRQKLRNPRQVAMESRIEAGDLGDSREPALKRLDQRNLPRQMGQVKRLIPAEFPDQFGRHQLMGNQTNSAMDHPVADCCERLIPAPLANPSHQAICRLAVIYRSDRDSMLLLPGCIDGGQHRFGLADSIDLSSQDPFGLRV
jgi:hypothetical protein